MNVFKLKIFYLITLVIILSKCRKDMPPLSGENRLTAITVNDGVKDMVGNIVANNITFSDSAVAGTTQVTILAINFSDKASANAKTNDVIPINKILTITTENGSARNYAMSINVSTATMTGDGIITGDGMKITGNPVVSVPIVIGTITGAKLAIAGITASGATLLGRFLKLNNPYITELGILVTANETLNLELTHTNEVPNGATKIIATAEQLAFVNTPVTVIPLSFSVPSLASFTTYYFRGYAAISGGSVVYTNALNTTTLLSYTLISDDNFRNAILSCINTDGMTTLDGQTSALQFGCTESFDGAITTSGNYIRTDALFSITRFNYGFYNGKPETMKIRNLRGLEQMVNLTHLNVHANQLNSLDFSDNIRLTSLNVNNNQLNSLDLSDNTSLSILDIRNNASLICVVIDASQVAGETNAIDRVFKNGGQLLYTNCNYVEIPDTNFRNAILSCINTNGMTTLDEQTNAVSFGCTESFEGGTTASGNYILNAALLSITQFNYGIYTNKPDHLKIRSLSGIEQMVNLTHLNVIENEISNLDVSNNIALTALGVTNNRLIRVDISNNTALTTLGFKNNQLSSVDISNNTALTYLDVNNNLLRNLDISNNTVLNTLDVRNNTSLTCIRVDDSQLLGGSNEIDFVTKDRTQTLSGSCM